MLRGLPRTVWVLQGGALLNAFGNGLVIPFLLIYLNDVRGLSVAAAGLVAGVNALMALGSGILGGWLCDRGGPRRVAIAALLVMTVAYGLFPIIRSFGDAVILSGLAGAGSGAFRSSQATLLASIAPESRRHTVFAQQFMALNLGLGTGHLAGGLIASTSRPTTFTVLFLLDALTFLAFAGVLLTLADTRPPRAASSAAGGYRATLRDGVFIRLMLVNLVFVSAAIAPFMNLFPVFAKSTAAVNESGIGVVFFLNTVAILALQLPITRSLEGRRRMPVLVVMTMFWAAAWLLVATGGWLSAGRATIVFAVAAMVFAVGECLHSAVVGPLIADLAPADQRGRYLGLSTLVWQAGFIAGPSAGGLVLDARPTLLWPTLAGLCVVAGLAALPLERRIPVGRARTPASNLA